jgi:hypothetical protein
MFRVTSGPFWLLYKFYSKLIGWVIEGRKYATAGGDRAFLLAVLLVGNCEPLVDVLFFSIVLYKCLCYCTLLW